MTYMGYHFEDAMYSKTGEAGLGMGAFVIWAGVYARNRNKTKKAADK